MDLMNSLDADGNEKGGSNPPDLVKGTGQKGGGVEKEVKFIRVYVGPPL